MKTVSTPSAQLHVEHARRPGAPSLLLINSLGASLEMWDEQVPRLTERFDLIRFDARGHGRSTLTDPAEASIADLTRDALAVLDACGVRRAHVCGLSLGGMVAMHLAAVSPDRVLKTVLCNTTPFMPPREGWDARIRTAQAEGMAPLIEGTLGRWFTPAFHVAHPEKVDRVRAQLRQANPAGFIACCAAIRDMDQRELIRAITSETLVIGGTHDKGTTPEQAQLMASTIPHAKLVLLEAAHLSNVECAEAFTETVLKFLDGDGKAQV